MTDDHDQVLERLRIHAVFWNSLGHGSVAHALTELLENLPQSNADPTLWSLGRDPLVERSYVRPALPSLLFRALCKARVPADVQGRLARRNVLRSLREGDIVYAWPHYDVKLIRRAQDIGAIVVAERTNCMGDVCRAALTRAFARRGKPYLDDRYTEAMIAEERAQMLQCDFVTAPNSFVAQSLEDAGVPRERVLDTFYGFSPTRLKKAIDVDRRGHPPVFAYVGHGIVRKGLDVLLDAWVKARINGRLLIAGPIDDELQADYAEVLARPDVEALGHVKDVAAVYASADVFVFPTHEEGGPQVIYEAAGCGLPSIVSPMGAGRLARDGIECILIDPLSVDDLAAALTKLAEDEGLRRALGEAARERAAEFTWSKAGEHLYRQFARAAGR